jgi:hypothetical protein
MTYRQMAKKRWPKACWIDGDGGWALLAHCRVLSVSLWPTREEAEKSKAGIDRTGCGGCCANRHEIVHLAGAGRRG